jgi:hypothetical protein
MSAESALINVLEATRLKGIAKRVLQASPASRLLRARQIRRRKRLVDVRELTPLFTDALSLVATGGAAVGDYLEFGVYNGTSLARMHKVLVAAGNRHSRLVGFDSFAGLPEVAATDSGGHWAPGEFSCSIDFTRSVLDFERVDWTRVQLVKGYFDTTLTPARRATLGLRHASLIMVDCDLYQSTREALQFCTPLVAGRAVMFFDDWFPLADRNLGEKKAFDEWLVENPQFVAYEFRDFKPYGRAFVVERRQGGEPAA